MRMKKNAAACAHSISSRERETTAGVHLKRMKTVEHEQSEEEEKETWGAAATNNVKVIGSVSFDIKTHTLSHCKTHTHTRDINTRKHISNQPSTIK